MSTPHSSTTIKFEIFFVFFFCAYINLVVFYSVCTIYMFLHYLYILFYTKHFLPLSRLWQKNLKPKNTKCGFFSCIWSFLSVANLPSILSKNNKNIYINDYEAIKEIFCLSTISTCTTLVNILKHERGRSLPSFIEQCTHSCTGKTGFLYNSCQ